MTRFARAKGSKSSNERREEDATPWHVMRQQMVNQSSNNDGNNEDLSHIVKNVKSNQTDANSEIWSDFGEIKQTTLRQKGNVIKLKSKMKEPSKVVYTDTTFNQSKIKQNVGQNTPNNINMGLKEKTKKLNNPVVNDLISNKKCRPKKLNKNIKQDCGGIETQDASIVQGSISKEVKNGTGKLSTKNKMQIKNITKDQGSKTIHRSGEKNKFAHDQHYNNFSSYKIVANGREIEIVRYDGFLVKKDDAKKLKELRKKLRSQNITTEQVKAIMKLERRKAEKALAREKNTVCFHCRQFGHNFAECPDIKESDASKSGMCFKCGSTEHTHFQCKVSQNQNFRFAVCFVCKEQGHIARQCTLNPQGQYPKGGSCHLCGEVTHLRKDCPKAVEDKPSKTLTVKSLDSRHLEEIEDVKKVKTKSSTKTKKRIKF